MNRSRIQIAKPDIVAYLNEKGPRVLKHREIGAILSAERRGWRLTQKTTIDEFIGFLAKSADLKEFEFDLPNRPEKLYVWGSVPTLEMLLHLKANSYFSHYTALRMHGLTEQIPTSIYISHERAAQSPQAGIDQAAIDEAFKQAARETQNAVTFGDRRIVLVNSAKTLQLGVVTQIVKYGAAEEATVRLTNVERTLIDAVVRPIYTGGVFEVAKAFELAKEQVSVNGLSAMLKRLAFTYPYHQAIGYYMERAGYRSRQLDLLRSFPMAHDFHLTHGMADSVYVKQWRLHVPRGL
ncbi:MULTISPECIES: type IV toxin-antitoxin system AbiEi family antitoxin domain-containing protein [unclassified Variovorax]|uniref:type IV toxin-antitoxin system AbiEi family antitoxin domain-containing protein n=1 Tax=unclassified Variovorax TaxID=663243 RepID=UPI00211C2FA8|nr:type IV toxin-antitoxin system AbiEi family antitoxin [Variovorax sp. YR752]